MDTEFTESTDQSNPRLTNRIAEAYTISYTVSIHYLILHTSDLPLNVLHCKVALLLKNKAFIEVYTQRLIEENIVKLSRLRSHRLRLSWLRPIVLGSVGCGPIGLGSLKWSPIGYGSLGLMVKRRGEGHNEIINSSMSHKNRWKNNFNMLKFLYHHLFTDFTETEFLLYKFRLTSYY